MATYTYINKHAAGIGTANAINYTVAAATTAIILSGTVTNTLGTDPVKVTITVNDGTTDVTRVSAVSLNPGDTMFPLDNGHWVLPTGYVLKIKSDTAASIDAMFDGVEIT